MSVHSFSTVGKSGSVLTTKDNTRAEEEGRWKQQHLAPQIQVAASVPQQETVRWRCTRSDRCACVRIIIVYYYVAIIIIIIIIIIYTSRKDCFADT